MLIPTWLIILGAIPTVIIFILALLVIYCAFFGTVKLEQDKETGEINYRITTERVWE